MLDLNLAQSSATDATSQLIDGLQAATVFPAVVEIPLPVSPVHWLRQQTCDVKIVWSDRAEGGITVGAGTARKVQTRGAETANDVIRRCRAEIGRLPLEFQASTRWFGGFAFRRDGHFDSSEWASFGNASFWLPRLTLENGHLRVIATDAGDVAAAVDAVTKIRWNSRDVNQDALPAWLQREDLPSRPEWFEQLATAKEFFRSEVLEKIVLARRADFEFERQIDPLLLLERLMPATSECYHFCFQTSPATAFLGATPERLFRRDGRQLQSEVVAGTRSRGSSEGMDEALGEQLLSSAKDQLEHDIVRKSIRQRLHAVVEHLAVDAQASLLKLATKQHLISRVSGSLKWDIDDGDLVDRLHPTPAVGGYPTENAMNEIRRLEPFERGWYAAPVGWVGNNSAEFAVGIRSALVQHNRLSLYSGAGIVPGSDPAAEWNEIEHKIVDFLQLVQQSARQRP